MDFYRIVITKNKGNWRNYSMINITMN